MKKISIFLIFALSALFVSCVKIDDILPDGEVSTGNEESNVPVGESSLEKMLTAIGEPAKMYSTPDDWELLMILYCNDLEGSDALIHDAGYNWFSVCGEYSSRNSNYRNPRIRYFAPYNMIDAANTLISSFDDDPKDPGTINMIAQARVLRAYSYMLLAPQYQFSPTVAGDQPCVPLVTPETEDFTNNPRATVNEVYAQIIDDLNYAVEKLEGASRSSKKYIDGNVAHGLRARAYLAMGEWLRAYDDAVKAADGYKPASKAEVSKPYFMDISEPCWIWGYDMAADKAMVYRYATTSGWLRSFSAWGYAAACQCYTCINKILWNKIPATDVRKGWWVDEKLESPNIKGLAWPGFEDVANADDGGDTKLPFLPYTNVKFGCYTVGTISNDEDMPLMRVEEMILIQAECKARMGDATGATKILTEFVQNYRDPDYDIEGRGLSLLDEIWFQRRVELWGEGFGVTDNLRLNKPLVRFLGTPESTNYDPAFRFNLPADDPWLLMRFPQDELNANFAIIDNTGGHQPQTDENPDLRDGVTDLEMPEDE